MAQALDPAETAALAALLRRLIRDTPGGRALAVRFPGSDRPAGAGAG